MSNPRLVPRLVLSISFIPLEMLRIYPSNSPSNIRRLIFSVDIAGPFSPFYSVPSSLRIISAGGCVRLFVPHSLTHPAEIILSSSHHVRQFSQARYCLSWCPFHHSTSVYSRFHSLGPSHFSFLKMWCPSFIPAGWLFTFRCLSSAYFLELCFALELVSTK